MKTRYVFAVCLLFPLSPYLLAKPVHVVLLNPGGKEWFWQMITSFMQAASDDLGMKLEVLSSDRTMQTVIQAKEITNRKIPPDYVVTGNEKSVAGQIIKLLNKNNIDVFLFSNGFVEPKDKEEFRSPRTRYPHWIGQLIPNNYSAGYQMGETLIKEAIRQSLSNKDGIVNIAAIEGLAYTHASVERVRGLKAAIENHKDKVRLVHLVSGDWTAKTSRELSKSLFLRHKNINILWGVNDSTAMGAMEYARESGWQPGKDILFGGCGWYAPAIQLVKNGDLTTTVGGHFMEAGWVMVMLYDYHHGIDFIEDPVETAMYAIDQNNVDKYLRVFGKQEWDKIDFRKFSKTYNPEIKHYDFSMNAVLNQFR